MLRNFTSPDWDAFAGACSLSATEPPMIGENDNWIIIVSGPETNDEEYFVQVTDAEDEEREMYTHSFRFKATAIAVAKMLMETNAVSLVSRELGFNRIF